MFTGETISLIPLILAIWLIPPVAYFVERHTFRKVFVPILERFGKQSRPVRFLLGVFVVAAILYGGTKPTQPQGQQPDPSASSTSWTEPSVVTMGGTDSTNASFTIYDFEVSTEERAVAFEATWSENAFDELDSRYVDLFMSTNLLTRRWFWLNDFWMPTETNRQVFVVDEYDVAYDMRTVFTNSFGRQAFFTMSLRMRKGCRYRLSMRWLNCEGHHDRQSPWHCWEARVDGQPSSSSYESYSNNRLAGNEIIVGNGWIADNESGLLTSHVCVCKRKSDGSSGGGNVAGGLASTLYVLDDPLPVPDYDRNGTIDDNDVSRAKQGGKLRFWINDDADSEATDGRFAESPEVDIPDSGGGPDWDDEEVNGHSDLVDFTPIWMDVSTVQMLPAGIRDRLSFRLRHGSGSLGAVWTGLSRAVAGSFQKGVVGSCGRNQDKNSHEAEVECLGGDGTEVPTALANRMRAATSDKGVLLVEGRSATTSPLKLEIYYDEQLVVTGELPLKISPIEDMYWFYSVRGAETTETFGLPNHYLPGNLPDDSTDRTVPDIETGVFHWPTLSWDWLFINLNITEEALSWQKQETRKGIDPVAGTLAGGWGFYCWTETFAGAQSLEYYSAAAAGQMMDNGSITNRPVFSCLDTQMDNRNATRDDVWRALAKYVPAVSSPVGGAGVDAVGVENHDLNGSGYRNEWGRDDDVYQAQWLHSDMKDMAFFHVYPLYEELTVKGDLK